MGPRLEIADIFRRFRDELGPLPPQSLRVVDNIVDCRTEKLGGHLRLCADCDYRDQSYNSCRNRHCPKCQFLATQRWVENRQRELLPVEYFHVVFTIPHDLNRLTLQNKAVLYDILFKTAADTLKEVFHRKFDAEVGFTAVLHTWGQNLMEHPHLHMIVAGGGLNLTKNSWVTCKKGYFLPLKILSTVFRGKFLSTLENSHPELSFHGAIAKFKDSERFKMLLAEASKKNWVIYAKKPFAGPLQVINYLGQYTHRIAISNHRLIKIENDRVHFHYRDYADNNEGKVMALEAKEFMRRFLLHVLPKKFVRIRYYGFLGNRFRAAKLSACRKILCHEQPEIKPAQKKNWKELFKELTGIDINLCPLCGGKIFESTIARLKKLQAPLQLDTS